MDYFAKHILLADGWQTNVRLGIGRQGEISSITAKADKKGAETLQGLVIPGLANLHSHAFQRAMAGLSEYRARGKNDFWSWRERMYRLANSISAEQLAVVASQLYVEMLKAGYTSVAEFHYLHHGIDGKSADMADQVMNAATRSGIGMTLLPVLYMVSNFAEKDPAPEQKRFVHSLDSYIAQLENLPARASQQLDFGVAFHSLRAVPADMLLEVVNYQVQHMGDRPVHIHIAEQQKEVEDCRHHYGTTPVEWLYTHADVNENWCLVHATHSTAGERERMATSGCVAGLCPSTEANLGDGFFPLEDYRATGGCFGIGSDSHVSVSPVEELRWLEYGQRLRLEQRNVNSDEKNEHCGRSLWQAALAGGARAAARPVDGFRVGNRADLLVLDDEHPLLYGKNPDEVLDSFIFAGNSNLVKDVIAGGEWLVKDCRHRLEDEINHEFKQVMRDLLEKI